MKVQVLFLILFLRNGLCKDDTLVGDLSPEVIAELLNMLLNTTSEILGISCPEPEYSDIELLLHTINDPVLVNLTNPQQVDPSKDVILLTHGWISNKNRFIPETTEAYLNVYDANVITVDWSGIASSLYSKSVCYLPKLARFLADFLCMMKERGANLDNVHMVGHSLGAHMSGYTGKLVQEKCGQKLGRITALDPAGPFFRLASKDGRVDKNDAKFVDAVHTNQGVLGFWGGLGHADFFVNCGILQLGCSNITLTWEGIKRLPVEVATCHHSRSVTYMTESISNPTHFPSKKCQACPLPCLPSVKGLTKQITMGEYCPRSAEGSYLLKSNFNPPFGSELSIPGSKSVKKFLPF